jgi:hypothetical protein
MEMYIQQGYVHWKMNIKYSSKYVNTKEAHGQRDIPVILTSLHITAYFFIRPQKSKPKKYIVFTEKPLTVYNEWHWL